MTEFFKLAASMLERRWVIVNDPLIGVDTKQTVTNTECALLGLKDCIAEMRKALSECRPDGLHS